jgi:hypothetical protein
VSLVSLLLDWSDTGYQGWSIGLFGVLLLLEFGISIGILSITVVAVITKRWNRSHCYISNYICTITGSNCRTVESELPRALHHNYGRRVADKNSSVYQLCGKFASVCEQNDLNSPTDFVPGLFHLELDMRLD